MMMTKKLTHKIKKILLVEDVQVAQMAAKLILRNSGLTVDIATSGHAALEALAKKAYDLIFVDIDLGDMTGFEVVDQLRSKQGPNKNANVFALTAYKNDEEYTERASKMQGYLVKPIDTQILSDLLTKLTS